MSFCYVIGFREVFENKVMKKLYFLFYRILGFMKEKEKYGVKIIIYREVFCMSLVFIYSIV